MRPPMNDKPYSHNGRHGTEFKSDRCDLASGVEVTKPEGITDAQFAADLAEFGAFHALNIREDLNGFSGYDCVDYTVIQGD